MKSEIREFKTTENKLKRVHLYLQNKYAGRHHNKDSDGERDHLDPQKKLKKWGFSGLGDEFDAIYLIIFHFPSITFQVLIFILFFFSFIRYVCYTRATN